MPQENLTTKLLAVLGHSLDVGFNVFDVMHHGTHEKQLSNVFRWILETGGTHRFESLGQRLFIQQVNLGRSPDTVLPPGPYTIRQEVNTSMLGENEDIADLVLENDAAVIVVENYETSDGHGHSYRGYQQFSQREGKIGAVVILCAEEHKGLLIEGWERASVVTYERFLTRLVAELDGDPAYEKDHPEQYAFIGQMHRKYVRGKGRMSDTELLDFVSAMCATGEANRYRDKNIDLAAEKFASDVAQQARERFVESRDVLRRAKTYLRSYCGAVLAKQLNTTLGFEYIRKVSANYAGIYQWAINFDTTGGSDAFGDDSFQIKFGPSAWYANESDSSWIVTIAPDNADYSLLFLTGLRNRELRQSSVSLDEVIRGLSSDDRRLHDEIIALLRS